MDPLEIAKDVESSALAPSDVLLSDMVAVVTGGGGGIGQGISLALAKFGADVVVIDAVPERADRTAQLVTALGRRGMGLAADVMRSDQLEGAITAAHDQLGRVDVLVNNAGGVRAGLFLDQSERSVRRHVDLNLLSVFTATAIAAPLMIGGGRGGCIVNVTSIEAFRAAPSFAVYAACKAAVTNFTRSMAVELGAHGIRVNCIAPDHTITPGTRGNFSGPVDPSQWRDDSPETDAALERAIPLGRYGVAEECAAAVIFLCSPMSAYVTGGTIHVDGGTHAAGGWLRDDGGGWTVAPGWRPHL